MPGAIAGGTGSSKGRTTATMCDTDGFLARSASATGEGVGGGRGVEEGADPPSGAGGLGALAGSGRLWP